ncbi:MAG: transposase, partial [Syntrophomonadaceae bacterium]|nr:transposase [Syntrophomonadaceae bacterium]
CVRYMILSVENRDQNDDRSCGGIFFDFCAEADALSFAKAFILLLNLFANLMKERLFLTDETINNLLHDFMDTIPKSLKNCLPLNAA